MLLWQALILGLIQGVGELFSVSSLAQTILLPALHLATAVALAIYFWKDWEIVIRAFLGSLQRKKLVYDAPSKFAWLLVAGTLVVGAVGGAFEKRFRVFFDDPKYYWIVAAILVVNGVLMLAGDFAKRKAALQAERKKAEELSFPQGILVGAAQTLALVPGISRSGVTIVGGILAGLSYEEASRFSFMLATPVIGLAALLKLPALLKSPAAIKLAAPAALVSGVAAYLSVAFLMRYFKHNRLSPFGYYCIAFGAFAMMALFR